MIIDTMTFKQMEIEENNLESVIEETAEIADTVEDFKEIDLEYINEIMEKSAISNGKSRFVSNSPYIVLNRYSGEWIPCVEIFNSYLPSYETITLVFFMI